MVAGSSMCMRTPKLLEQVYLKCLLGSRRGDIVETGGVRSREGRAKSGERMRKHRDVREDSRSKTDVLNCVSHTCTVHFRLEGSDEV